MEGLIIIGAVFWLFTRDLFKKPPAKSAEEQLGESIAKYLSKDVKVRMENHD